MGGPGKRQFQYGKAGMSRRSKPVWLDQPRVSDVATLAGVKGFDSKEVDGSGKHGVGTATLP
jgi:hypothetical protein